MAITRHANRVRHFENSRQLRWGRRYATRRSEASPLDPVLKPRPFPTLVPRRRKGSKQSARSQRTSATREFNHEDSQQLSHDTHSLNKDDTIDGCISASGHAPHELTVPDVETNSFVTRTSISASATFTSRVGSDLDGVISVQESLPMSLEDSGIPSDGLWDHNAAYNRRFCFDHGEAEYLLGTADRWMSADDFDDAAAESGLEVLLQQHKDSPRDFDPHSRHCQAECWGSLYSHVHNVIDNRVDGNMTLFLVQWKVCWTPESHITDKGWISASLEANKDPRCRRSTRLANGFEGAKQNYEKIMLVVNLDR